MSASLRRLKRRLERREDAPQWVDDAVAAIEHILQSSEGGWGWDTGLLAVQGRDGVEVVPLGGSDVSEGPSRAHAELAERLPLQVREKIRASA